MVKLVHHIEQTGKIAVQPFRVRRARRGAPAPLRPEVTSCGWTERGKRKPSGRNPKIIRNLTYPPTAARGLTIITDAGNTDIWIWDISHQTQTRLTFDKAEDSTSVWTPDGKRIVFSSTRGETLYSFYWRSAYGVGEVEPLGAKPDRLLYPRSFSPDGKFLATSEFSLTPPGADIGIMSMEGDRDMSFLLKGGLEPRISPDGRYMAYQSDESGTDNIYAHPFPDVNEGKWQVSNNGGNSPLRSPDGWELFYRNGDATMAVEVETGPAFRHGNPGILSRGTYSSSVSAVKVTSWDISHDGKRFLMIKPPAASESESSTAEQAAAAGQRKIVVVTNWFEELKERVPVKGHITF